MSTTASTPSVPLSFPQKVKATFVIEFEVNDQEEYDYIKPDPTTNEVQVGVIADLYDQFTDNCAIGIVTINGKTFKEVKQAMSKLMP